MPGLDGAATLPLLLELRPYQTVLLSSGYSDQDSNALGAGRPRVFSIRKPFTLAEIRQKLASLGLGVEVSPGR